MALRNSSQEVLNLLAGFTGSLRTKQECYNALAGVTGRGSGDAAHSWAAFANGSIQDALNFKAGTVGLTKQDALHRIKGISI